MVADVPHGRVDVPVTDVKSLHRLKPTRLQTGNTVIVEGITPSPAAMALVVITPSQRTLLLAQFM